MRENDILRDEQAIICISEHAVYSIEMILLTWSIRSSVFSKRYLCQFDKKPTQSIRGRPEKKMEQEKGSPAARKRVGPLAFLRKDGEKIYFNFVIIILRI